MAADESGQGAGSSPRGQRAGSRRIPRQSRARNTVDAILEAAARLVDDTTGPSATTTRIAHVAGVSIGSLYQYFPGKEALFDAMIERAIEDDLERLERAVDVSRELSLEDGVRHVLREGFTLPLTRPRLFTWIMHYLPGIQRLPSVRRFERGCMQALRRFLHEHEAELSGVDTELFEVAGVGAIRGALMLVAAEHPEWLESERMLDFCVELALGWLRLAREKI